jgi:hypothetical protein
MRTTNFRAFKQCVTIGNLILAACAFIGPVGRVSARSREAKDRPVVRVGVYNCAKTGQSELRQAESQSAAIFAMAGVQIVWAEYSAKPPAVWSPSDNPAPDFSVRILYASATTRAWRTSGVDVMGESIIPQGVEGPVAGGIANVFYDRVKEVVSASGPFSAEVLGEAIAHELGHLMLGPQHSRHGIMKILWTPQDQDLISHCELRFLPGQAKDLQRVAQSLQQDSSPTLVAQR